MATAAGGQHYMNVFSGAPQSTACKQHKTTSWAQCSQGWARAQQTFEIRHRGTRHSNEQTQLLTESNL